MTEETKQTSDKGHFTKVLRRSKYSPAKMNVANWFVPNKHIPSK